MKLSLFGVLALALLTTFGWACAAQAADFTVRSLDLYPSGAKFVLEVASQGDFEIELPGAFREDSVRLLNPLDAEDFKVVSRRRADWTPPALAGLKAEVEAQAAAVARLNARKSAFQQTLRLLEAIDPAPEDGTQARDLIAYVREAQTLKLDAEKELAELTTALALETEKLEVLREELEARTPDGAGSFLLVSGHGHGDAVLLLEAFAEAAEWSPRYTMNLTTATGAIETDLFALAEQRTGLDYSGVVTFHTKAQDEGVRAPELAPLRVALKPKEQDGDVRKFRRSMNDAVAIAPYAVAAPSAEAARPAPRRLTMTTTLSDRTVTGQGTLSGAGLPSTFTLGRIDLTGKPMLVLIPEQRGSAWLVASMDNAETSLIPGRADLMVDGAPAGVTSLPEYGVGQMRLPFGYAPLITASKEPLVAKTGSSWFSGVSTNGYRIKVTNGMAEDRTVTVRDRLPIPTDDKVKLEVKRIDPAPAERDPENRLTWELSVKAGETVEIVVDYALSYPSGEELLYR